MRLDESDPRLVQHLKGLVRAARDFHSSASTTANTIYEGSQRTQRLAHLDDGIPSGLIPALPSFKRRRIEMWNQLPIRMNTVSQTDYGHAEYPEVASNEIPQADLALDRLVSGGLERLLNKHSGNLIS